MFHHQPLAYAIDGGCFLGSDIPEEAFQQCHDWRQILFDRHCQQQQPRRLSMLRNHCREEAHLASPDPD